MVEDFKVLGQQNALTSGHLDCIVCGNDWNLILTQDDVDVIQHIDPETKEIKYNVKYDQLFSPTVCI